MIYHLCRAGSRFGGGGGESGSPRSKPQHLGVRFCLVRGAVISLRVAQDVGPERQAEMSHTRVLLPSKIKEAFHIISELGF